jgi:bifunctional non-homologous end joining protein LigD
MPMERQLSGSAESYEKSPGTKPYLYRFDLLALDGEDLRGRPLVERKEKLENLCGILRVIYTTADM